MAVGGRVAGVAGLRLYQGIIKALLRLYEGSMKGVALGGRVAGIAGLNSALIAP